MHRKLMLFHGHLFLIGTSCHESDPPVSCRQSKGWGHVTRTIHAMQRQVHEPRADYAYRPWSLLAVAAGEKKWERHIHRPVLVYEPSAGTAGLHDLGPAAAADLAAELLDCHLSRVPSGEQKGNIPRVAGVFHRTAQVRMLSTVTLTAPAAEPCRRWGGS
jgi:hypothetical protein